MTTSELMQVIGKTATIEVWVDSQRVIIQNEVAQ